MKFYYLIMKNNIKQIIVFLVSVLFLYAAVNKLVTHDAFVYQLSQSPLIPPEAVETVSYLVPIVEILLVLILYIQRTYMIALYSLFFLLFTFTAYIGLLLTIDENIPCSCGGILNNLSFEAHIIFNLFFLSLIGYNILVPDNPSLHKIKKISS